MHAFDDPDQLERRPWAAARRLLHPALPSPLPLRRNADQGEACMLPAAEHDAGATSTMRSWMSLTARVAVLTVCYHGCQHRAAGHDRHWNETACICHGGDGRPRAAARDMCSHHQGGTRCRGRQPRGEGASEPRRPGMAGLPARCRPPCSSVSPSPVVHGALSHARIRKRCRRHEFHYVHHHLAVCSRLLTAAVVSRQSCVMWVIPLHSGAANEATAFFCQVCRSTGGFVRHRSGCRSDSGFGSTAVPLRSITFEPAEARSHFGHVPNLDSTLERHCLCL